MKEEDMRMLSFAGDGELDLLRVARLEDALQGIVDVGEATGGGLVVVIVRV